MSRDRHESGPGEPSRGDADRGERAVDSGHGEAGPVPVRDLMTAATPESGPRDAESEPRWDRPDRTFEAAGEEWVARTAGAGAYGTGRRGVARLLAVHFFRAAEPDTPVREALVPAGVFPHLRPEELRTLFEGATPMEDRGDTRS